MSAPNRPPAPSDDCSQFSRRSTAPRHRSLPAALWPERRTAAGRTSLKASPAPACRVLETELLSISLDRRHHRPPIRVFRAMDWITSGGSRHSARELLGFIAPSPAHLTLRPRRRNLRVPRTGARLSRMHESTLLRPRRPTLRASPSSIPAILVRSRSSARLSEGTSGLASTVLKMAFVRHGEGAVLPSAPTRRRKHELAALVDHGHLVCGSQSVARVCSSAISSSPPDARPAVGSMHSTEIGQTRHPCGNIDAPTFLSRSKHRQQHLADRRPGRAESKIVRILQEALVLPTHRSDHRDKPRSITRWSA